MNVTIYDVAREAGVSMATVSRVVNGNPNVKPATRKKVMEVIKRLGYRPNAVARGLASKKTTTVGVIIPDISSLFYAELARGIEDIANMYKYNIILCNSDNNVDKELQLTNTLLEKQVDGILFLGGRVTPEHKDLFTTADVPIILAAAKDPSGELASVNIDYYQATLDLTKLFIANGHQRIAFISGPLEDPFAGQSRLEGYKAALHEAGIDFEEALVQPGDYRYESGIQGTQQLLELEQQPTAIIAMSDEMAVGAIHACLDKDISVPEQIEVAGFDNTRLCSMVRPTLTSVVQPTYDIGAVSMRLLTKYLNKERIDEKHVLLPHRVEFRNSTTLKDI